VILSVWVSVYVQVVGEELGLRGQGSGLGRQGCVPLGMRMCMLLLCEEETMGGVRFVCVRGWMCTALVVWW
jgi:hypothetical protein